MTMTPEELGQQDVLASLSEQQKATMMIRAFQMFELYDSDGNGSIDKDEYWELRYLGREPATDTYCCE